MAEMRNLESRLQVVLVVLNRLGRDRIDVGFVAGGGIEEDRLRRSVEPCQGSAVLTAHGGEKLAGANQNNFARHEIAPLPATAVLSQLRQNSSTLKRDWNARLRTAGQTQA